MNTHYPFTLTPLPYGYESLEPYLTKEILEFHHDKHLQTYVDNLNKTLEPFPMLHELTLDQMLSDLNTVPEAIRTAIKNNSGGVYNHEMYFDTMGKDGDKKPGGRLMDEIKKAFGSYDEWKTQMKQAALNQFGSGYAWLVEDTEHQMKVISLPNQDNPLSIGLKPLLLVDVWEHAYYLKYQNRRAEYLDNWFELIDWSKVRH